MSQANQTAIPVGATLTDSAPAVESAAAIGPVQQEERYVLMDVVRGFALFGVLAANMRSFNAPMFEYDHIKRLFPDRLDVLAQTVLDIFISGKFYTLFAFLFGLGFAIQITRAQARSATFPWFYLRRLGALAFFGLVHGILIWNGDILLPYSIGGFWLFWFRTAKLKAVKIWTVCLWGLGLLIIAGAFVAEWIKHWRHQPPAPATPPKPPPDYHAVINTYAHTHVWGVIKETAYLWTGGHPPSHAHPFLWMANLLPADAILGTMSLLLFLLGLWVWRQGILQDLARCKPVLRRVCAWTLPIGLAISLFAVIGQKYLPQGVPQPTDPPPTVFALLVNYALVLSFPVLACGYATLLATLFLNAARQRMVLWLAPVGRMALTNYLTHSIVCTAFYTGIITGLYGRVGPAWDWVATFVLFTAQIFFSHWWLRRFRFGPAEWLWRALTYGKRPAMRIQV